MNVFKGKKLRMALCLLLVATAVLAGLWRAWAVPDNPCLPPGPPGRLHLEVQQGTQVIVIPTRHLLFTTNATFDLLIPSQQIQTQHS